jgi:Ca2+-binding RTX toxin-like protein
MAPISKVGLEILVNTGTEGTQFIPQIATLSNGGFVVTWQDGFSGLGEDANVEAQVFTAAGVKTGSEILVNTATENDQSGQQITALANGGFVVTWTDSSHGIGGATGDDSSTAIKAQVFAADGTKTGSEILVNTAVASEQFDPQITALADGGFVATWTDYSEGNGGATGDRSEGAIKAQVFTAAGAETGSEIRVNTATRFDQINQQVTALENGGFVVTWEDFSQGVGGAPGDDGGIDGAVKAQVFAADGTKTGSEILVNTAVFKGQFDPQITALSNGSFVVTWRDGSEGDGGATGDDSSTAIKAQVFAANGTKTGSEILVNTAILDSQFDPQITALSDGGFVVSWVDDSGGIGGATGDGSGFAIKAQVFTAAGEKTGSEILINTATRSNQSDPQITALENGDFVVAWRDFSGGAGGASGDYSSTAIKAQMFTAGGTKTGSEILVNTATQGSQSRVQITALPGDGFVVTWEDFSDGANGDGDGAVKAQVFGHNPDPDNTTPPTITTAPNQDVAEDSTFVAALTSTDPNPSGINPALFTISGGVDGAQFDIVDGNLLFKEAKDFETDPHLYRVNVTAFDGFNTSSRTITVNITDVAGVTIDGTAAADIIDATHAPTGEPFPTDDDDTITGFARSDTIHGLGGGDWISGGGASDTLFGDDGNDRLNGGRGADAIHGGAGDDLYIVDNPNDAVVENADGGTDRIAAWLDFTLGDNVENLILKGGGDLSGTGNARGNEIFGNDGNNILYGGAGTHTEPGITGSDLLRGGAGNDLFVFRALSDSLVSSSRDVIRDFLIGADQIDLTAIDANTRFGFPGDQAFNFIGSDDFTRTAGELQAKAAGTNTLVSGDVNGNGRPDFQILVSGHVDLQATDFRL